MSLRIVTHAYAGRLPQYAVFLRVQLSSLVLDKTDRDVRITVCCAPRGADPLIDAVLADFASLLGDRLQCRRLPVPALCRRAIGRSWAAHNSTESLVWFADVDYFWGWGCLDHLCDTWDDLSDPRPVLLWPRVVMNQESPEAGDAFLESLARESLLGRFLCPDRTGFFARSNGAIGGAQIAAGSYVREHGYIDQDVKFHQPVKPGDKIFHTRSDSKFRKKAIREGGGMGINLPGVYRLRHTATTYKDNA